MLYKTFVRPILFNVDPEVAHQRALRFAERAGRSSIARDTLTSIFRVDNRRLHQNIFGIEFPNPVGLAAGYDKNARGLALWPALGFGFVELGSVTAQAQDGNPPPRLFRQPEQQALINRMGFNNDGAEVIAARIPSRPHPAPIGINIGKSRTVELSDAALDYRVTLEKFEGRADFFVINVSSPNTPGLRKLQDRAMLDELLSAIRTPTPTLLKLAPDLGFEQMDDALELVQKHKLAGVVATNTTTDHPTPPEGGLSGAPLRERSTACVRHLYRQTQGKLPIVGVGGIFNAAHAYEKIRAGASLVEIWTGMIYEGPSIVRDINRGLLRLLERDGFSNLAEAVGTG